MVESSSRKQLDPWRANDRADERRNRAVRPALCRYRRPLCRGVSSPQTTLCRWRGSSGLRRTTGRLWCPRRWQGPGRWTSDQRGLTTHSLLRDQNRQRGIVAVRRRVKNKPDNLPNIDSIAKIITRTQWRNYNFCPPPLGKHSLRALVHL